MFVRMGILPLAISMLLMVADSNGGLWRPGDGVRSLPHRLSGTEERPDNSIPHPGHFLGKLDLPLPQSEMLSFHPCKRNGFFAIPGTRRGFYKCQMTPDSGEFSISFYLCPPGSIFDDISTCLLPSRATTRPKCKTQESISISGFPDAQSFYESEGDNRVNGVRPLIDIPLGGSLPLTRRKRQIPLLAGFLAHDLTFKPDRRTNDVYTFIAHETNLDRIENKLIGYKGMLNNVSLPILESQTARKMFTGLTQLVADTRLRNIRRNFEQTQQLISNDLLEDLAITTVLQGMVSDESELNDSNLAEVKVTLKEVEDFIKQEIDRSKTYIREGFEFLSDSSDQSVIEPLVSSLLNLTTEFKHRLNHLQSLPERHQEIEIERSGGYVKYLQPSTLQDTLHDIIDRDLAIPKTDSDTTALALLDLLVQGLQIHANLLSFTVSAKVFTARKALKDRNLEKFNMRMTTVPIVIRRLKTSIGSSSSGGMLSTVNALLDHVEELSHSLKIDGLVKLLNETRVDVDQIESDVNRLIEGNVILPKPEKLTEELDFSASSIPIPFGKWATGKQVSYATQFISRNGISKVSDWSKPYSILDKAHPIVHIPTAEDGITRLVYRRFDQDKPELVAILTDNNVNSFRDIDKDVINAAVGTNVDETVEEVRALLNDGANANHRFEDEMTPLHYAAKHGNVRVMDILIKEEADIGAKSFDGEEPLHLAAFSGAEDAVKYLISKGANVSAQTKPLELSPLHIAVANNHASSVEALIVGGAHVNIQDRNGMSPLHLAVAGNKDVLDVLLSSDQLNINAVTKGGLTALHLAVGVSDNNLVLELLNHENISVNPLPDSHLSPIHLASINGHVDVLASMIRSGLPTSAVDKDGSSPLHYAAFYGNLRAVLVLVQIDQTLKTLVNNDNKTALDIAIEVKRESIADILRDDIHNISEFIENELQDQPNTQISTANCSKEVAEKFILRSDEICDHIDPVDSYVNLIQFMIPLHKYYESQSSSSKIFEDYDRDLIAAQNHAKIWRDGDSIVNGIRQIFGLAKEFEPEFSRKYKINKERIKTIQQYQASERAIRDRENNITHLNSEISEIREMLSKIKNPGVKSYLERTLIEKQKQVDQKLEEGTDESLTERELKEIADFLKSVKINSARISEVASVTREKVQTFKQHLKQDTSAFRRHNGIASAEIYRWQMETLQNNETLAGLYQKRERLELQIVDHKQEIRDLENKIRDSKRENREQERKLQDDIDYYYGWKVAGWVTLPLLLGIPMLIHSYKEEAYYYGVLQDTIEQHGIVIQSLESHILYNEGEISKYDDMIISNFNSSEQLRNKMRQLISLDRDLNTLLSDSETLIRAIDKALEGITVIKGIFDGVNHKLDEMIFKAETAGDGASKLNAKHFIYEEISMLECNWRDIHFKIVSLDECTRSFQIVH